MQTWSIGSRAGGALIFVDSRQDAYNNAHDWWNSSIPSYETPGDHLMTSFGLASDQTAGKYPYGKGWVYVERKRPTYYARSSENADEYRRLIANACQTVGLEFFEHNYFLKRRGPYVLAANITESQTDAPLVLDGRFVNLFDASLQIVDQLSIQSGERVWALDLNKVTASSPCVLASSCRIESLVRSEDGTSVLLDATSPSGIEAVSLLRLERCPSSVTVDGVELKEIRWDESTQTLFFSFPSSGSAKIVIVQ